MCHVRCNYSQDTSGFVITKHVEATRYPENHCLIPRELVHIEDHKGT